MIRVTHYPPPIIQSFNSDLLSTPMIKFRDDADMVLPLAQFLEKKIKSRKHRKFLQTIQRLEKKHQNFMELYERAKTKERDIEKEVFIKAKSVFYRIRLHNQSDESIFRRLRQKNISVGIFRKGAHV
jgi:hypothetical protein